MSVWWMALVRGTMLTTTILTHFFLEREKNRRTQGLGEPEKNPEKNPAAADADVEGWLCVDSTDISSEQEAEEDKTGSAIK